MAELGALSVIIADDHPLFRDGVRRVLEQHGFAIAAETTDGPETVDCVRERKPAILLLDLSLPGASGIDVLRRLRDLGETPLTILLTASIERREIITALELGARGVVMKDSAADVLVRAISAVVHGELWIGRDVLADFAAYVSQGPRPQQSLTAREREIIEPVLQGKTNREIARELRISEDTVKRHITHIFDKLGVSNRMELALFVNAGKLYR